MIRIMSAMWPALSLLGGIATAIVLWVGGMAVVRGRDHARRAGGVPDLPRDAALADGGVRLGHEPVPARSRVDGADPRDHGPRGRGRRGRGRHWPRAAGDATRRAARRRRSAIRGPSAWCSRGVDLTLRPGESVAIVGRTGSGKTTLLNLIARLYEPTEGALLLGGVPAERWPRGALRRRFGIVPQETFLFSQTIRENIAFGFDDGDAAPDRCRAGGRAPRRPRARPRPVPARARDDARRARHHALGRPEAARGAGARARARAAGAAARRRLRERGPRHRGAHPRDAVRARAAARDPARDPPALGAAARGPHRRAGRGPDRRDRHPRRADRGAAGSTPTSIAARRWSRSWRRCDDSRRGSDADGRTLRFRRRRDRRPRRDLRPPPGRPAAALPRPLQEGGGALGGAAGGDLAARGGRALPDQGGDRHLRQAGLGQGRAARPRRRAACC